MSLAALPDSGETRCPSRTSGAGGGAPLGSRVPLGSGHLNAGKPGAAPEVFGIDAALLERSVNPRLQHLVGQQIMIAALTNGPEEAISDSDATNWPSSVHGVGQVVLAFDQHVADRVDLGEDRCSGWGCR